MKKILFSILLILLSLCIDFFASKYANGLYIIQYKLNFGTSLIYVNDKWITYFYKDQLSYINTDKPYITALNDTINIKEIIGYSNNEEKLSILISDNLRNYKIMEFKDSISIYNFSPEINEIKQSEFNSKFKNWIIFKNIPLILYFSKPIILFLNFISLIIVILGLKQILTKSVPRWCEFATRTIKSKEIS